MQGTPYDRTVEFLKLLTRRLSSRMDCKGIEYHIHIYNDGITQVCDMFPSIYVFPDIHHRKRTDKQNVISFILASMDVSHAVVSNHQIVINTENQFTPGIYTYRCGWNSKVRRWYKYVMEDYNEINVCNN